MLFSRADLFINLTFATSLLAPLVTFFSARMARKRSYDRHRRLQVALLAWCWISVLVLEVRIRLSGGSGAFVQLAPDEWEPFARQLLLVHIAGAIATYGLWTWLTVVSSRRFQHLLPGRFSRLHKRLGWTVFGGLCFTAASAAGMYTLAFAL